MAIPLSYNLRNLRVRKTTTLMTALGIALTVAVLLAVMALVEGLRTSLGATGDPLNVLVMRKGSTSELASNFSRTQYQDVKFKAGIARDQAGQPLASLEMVTIIVLARPDRPEEGANITVRGITSTGLELRNGLKLSSGRWFRSGRREIVVGKTCAERFPAARMGQRIHFGRGEWEVVGIMDAGGSAANSEIFVDLNQVSSDYNREEVLSSALLRATDQVAVAALVSDLENDRKLNVTALTERDYYAQQMTSAEPIKYIGLVVAIIMAVGSAFAAMNTMYAAVSRRAAEIGTLRVLGFSRASILFSFLIESLLLSALGGLLGCVLALPLNGVTTGIGNFVTFSEMSFDFRVTPAIMATGMAFAVLMGAFGGFFPARWAAKKQILDALGEA
jgi:putative ABC transport system permease protein